MRHFQKAKSSFVALSGRCRNESERKTAESLESVQILHNFAPRNQKQIKSNFERCFINAPSGKPANLIICNGARLFAGVMIDEGDALNIYSQEGDGGETRATAAHDRVNHWKYPGIGSRRTMGTLTIHGGKITAISKGIDEIAAIGGGNKGSGGGGDDQNP